MDPAPVGILVLGADMTVHAANRTLLSLAPERHGPERATSTLQKLTEEFRNYLAATAPIARNLSQGLAGEVVVWETDHPPIIGPSQGQWVLHFLPFTVAPDRGVAILFEDCTEQRITTEAFHAAEQRFRLLVDAAADGIAIFRDQILLYVNPEAVRLLGFNSPDELVGRPLSDLVDGEHRTSFDASLAELQSRCSSGAFETAFLRGRVAFPVECRISSARIDDMGAGFLFFRDIAERKRLQSRRETAKRVDSLARLATVLGSELQHFASRIRRLTQRNSELEEPRSQGLLELSQLANEMLARAGELTCHARTTGTSATPKTLEEVVGRVCEGLKQRGASSLSLASEVTSKDFAPTGIVVDLEPAEYALRGDAETIEWGLTSLAAAAWKSRGRNSALRIRGLHSPKGSASAKYGYVVSIGGVTEKATGGGRGATTSTFPPSASPFASWEQGRDVELLSAFSALQSQGCSVEAHPSLTGGLCFDVELLLDPSIPAMFGANERSIEDFGSEADGHASVEQESHPAVTRRDASDRPPVTERSPTSGALEGQRSQSPILICDDEARLVALTAGLLREYGFDVVTVRSGVEAVRAVAAHPIDVVILDINLPGEDAREVLVQMQGHRDISVILSSGYTEEDVDPLLLHASAVKAFLSKPYTVDVLVSTIDNVRSTHARENLAT